MRKYSTLNIQQSIFNVFPWKEELSNEIEYKKFCESFFIQPDLFIRLFPGKEQVLKHKLQQAGIEFKVISNTCLAFPNSSGIDKVIELDKEAVIQDTVLSKQRKYSKTSNLKLRTSNCLFGIAVQAVAENPCCYMIRIQILISLFLIEENLSSVI
jgi:hypothetical protein